ncbi:MAG: hypothetical protein AAF533_23910 [Acidobacteriota bacterium]
MTLTVDEHPLLRLVAFTARLPGPLEEHPSPDWLIALLAAETADAPLRRDDDTKKAVRLLLRHGGFRPSGRSRPASEYLARVAEGDGLGSINLAVDLGNVVSLHSGLPVSVVDLDRLSEPLRVGVVPPDAEPPHSHYVFNPSGQELSLKGLLCLHDADGATASPVKDAQRTKTDGTTRSLLCLVWGSSDLTERTETAASWFRELCERAGLTELTTVD